MRINFMQVLKSVAVIVAALIQLYPQYAFAERHRLVISQYEVANELSSREIQALKQSDLIQLLREAMIDSRSFSVLTRENNTVQAILKERQIQDSPLSRENNEQGLGLDITSYFLQPTIKRFDIVTRYQPMELLKDMYERNDSFYFDFSVRIFDTGGNILFEERVERQHSLKPVEADEAERRRNSVRGMSVIRDEIKEIAREIADAVVARINPIVVLDVQGNAIIIDRGKNNGFDMNTRLAVYGESKTIVHPRTGESRTIPGAYIGDARVSRLYEDIAELQLIEGSVEAVKIGCIVRIIKE